MRSASTFLAGAALGGACCWFLVWLGISRPPVGHIAKSEHPKEETRAIPKLDHERFMRLAIEQAKNSPKLPFGAIIVDSRSGEVLAEGHNHTVDSPTFHGEIDVINRLAESPKRPADWAPLVLYTTAEPCPMCQSAIEWSGMGAIVFGSSIPFLQQQGWWQIDIRAQEVIQRTPFRQTAIQGGVLEKECNALFLAVPPKVPSRKTERPPGEGS